MAVIRLQGRGPNTMSRPMLVDFEGQLDALRDEPLVITGAGTAFSAGLDLDALQAATHDDVAELLTVMERVVRKLFLHPRPTVALVSGHAVAGGCLVAQCCDVRLGVDDDRIRIGMPGVAIGLVYPPWVFAVLEARVPAGSLETVLLGADSHSPADALRLGLLDAIVPRDGAEEAAAERLNRRVALPAAAYASTKRTLREPAIVRAAADHERFVREVVPSWTGALRRVKRG